MSDSLLCSTFHKQYLSLKCKTNPNNTKLAQYYKKYKNNYTRILRDAKMSYYQNKFISVKGNPKFIW